MSVTEEVLKENELSPECDKLLRVNGDTPPTIPAYISSTLSSASTNTPTLVEPF